MASNPDRAEKMRQTLAEQYGSYEAYLEQTKIWGKQGGKMSKKPKGFAANKDLAREAGKKGGMKGKRDGR